MYLQQNYPFHKFSHCVLKGSSNKETLLLVMERFLLPATYKRTVTLHLFCVGAIHKPGGTYITVLRRAKEKFCSDVQSRSVASSSNATMLSTVQLSAVAPTLWKRRENIASPKSLKDGQKFISFTIQQKSLITFTRSVIYSI